ncbi:MAG: hypothetical protein L6R37_000381 [Teloschistes peruensis]|nr:MAG: hypothetical protein L6R37_000381 [Teloschistes peruensis]
MSSSPSSTFYSSNLSPFKRALLAGALAGTTVDLSLYPIDTLKTRLQSSTGFAASGGFRGIYAGVGSVLIGSAPGAALFFVTYEGFKSQLQILRQPSNGRIAGGEDEVRGLSKSVDHMLAASAGEIAACAVRVPTEVIKQRAQAAQQPSSIAVLRFILARRSDIGVVGVWREMYRGWGITIMREVPFTAIQFPLWEGMKAWRRRQIAQTEVSALESGAFGSVAGAVAAALTTPLDVLKTRLMLAQKRQSAASMVVEIWKTSGPRAFLSGIGPRIMWISAGGAIFLGTYQWAYNSMIDIT